MTTLSPFHPEIDKIWRALVAAGARSVAVVSGGAGEGTTLIAAALARRAAIETGKSALLADLNCARPAVARLLGVRPQPGVTVALTSLGLSVLTAPTADEVALWRDPSVLAHRAEQWALTHGLVVFDTAPVLSRGDDPLRGATAAAAADATVLVVQSGPSSLQIMQDTRSRLIVAGARLLATVSSERDKVALLTRLENRPSRIAPAVARAKATARGSLRMVAAIGRIGALLPAPMRSAS